MKKILFVPNPILRQKAIYLNKISKEDINISKKMINIMIEAPGVGLAANQIGILKRIITINIHDQKNNKNNVHALFNPRIINYSKKKIIMEEGCLSLPKQYAEIERSEKITVEYFNEINEKIVKETNGFEARVLQHEIDHLDGKLFIDYLSSLKRNIIVKKVQKLIKIKEV